MKLNTRDVHPENNTMHLAVKCRDYSGNVGLVLFRDGKWYVMPREDELLEKNEFMWISWEDHYKGKP